MSSTSQAVVAPVDVAEDDSQYELIDNVASTEKKNEEMKAKLMLALKAAKRRIEELEEKLALAEKKEPLNEEVSGTFSVKFTEISNLGEEDVYSPVFELAGMKWSLSINKNEEEQLGAYLGLMSPATAKCFASYTISLFNDEGVALQVDIDNVCLVAGNQTDGSDVTDNWGEDKIIAVKDLMSPKENECYYNAADDSIILQVVLTVHGSVDQVPVVSVGPKEVKEEDEDTDDDDEEEGEEEEEDDDGDETPRNPCNIL